jgi:hypothetical protein
MGSLHSSKVAGSIRDPPTGYSRPATGIDCYSARS